MREAAMRTAVLALGALFLGGAAIAQSGGPALGTTATPKGGASESFGARSGWQPLYDANGHLREADYRAMLASRIAQAQALVGQPLTDRDRKKIRSAMRGDFIAWRKQYDPRPKDYGALRDRWIVDEAALSPEAWAKQRVDWLRAQHEWILANVGEIEAQAARAR
jgi:hypothetical protein